MNRLFPAPDLAEFFDDSGSCPNCGAAVAAKTGLWDWESGDGALYCIPCVIAGAVFQAPSPGRCCFGVFDAILPPDGDDRERAVLLNSAGFWRSVWQSRVESPPEIDPYWAAQRRPETATAARLAVVSKLLALGEWPAAALALEPVASRWLQEDRPREERLWCWESRNTRRAAILWAELERQIFAGFAPEIQQQAIARGYMPPRLAMRWTG